jgi:hypothetical protein
MVDSDNKHDHPKNLKLPLDITASEDLDGALSIDEPIEAYCVRCRKTVDVLNAEPVWTSKGTPGMRGTCPECGTTVFRLGKTAAHEHLERPNYVRVASRVKVTLDGKKQRALPATYINYDHADAEFAEKLAEDLEKSGIHIYIEISEDGEAPLQDVKWAGGIHPALKDSKRMVVVLSERALKSERMNKAWSFFRTQKKPITIILVKPVEVPDALRRSTRIDFTGSYKTAFRQLVSALSD